MKRSKRIEILDKRPVNLDGYINEWPEMGFVAMKSPYDPTPSVKVENGKIVELDGKKREEFDFIDQFIADYAINISRTENFMKVPALDIARMIVDIHVSRKEILELVSGITPARMAEVMNYLNVVELMMGMQKMRARKTPGNQAHITNLKDDPVQLAADAAEGALRGFAEEETTMGVARYAPLSAIAILIGSQIGRPGVLTQCSAEEATELELGIRGLTTYAETLSVYGTEKVFIDGDDTPYSKAFLNSAYASRSPNTWANRATRPVWDRIWITNTATTAWGTRIGSRTAYSIPPRVFRHLISAMDTSTPRTMETRVDQRAIFMLTHTALKKSVRRNTCA